jgi:pimeloyl-ACP methyl ester carboxylesterase
VIALALGACAALPPPRETDAAGTIVIAPLELDGSRHDAHWYLPAGEARALIVLEHGYTRGCRHLRETTRQLMADGLMALCVDLPMAGGNPALADALARRVLGDLAAPDGAALPARLIVAGHSAGARFALRLGARLAETAPARLAGALLFDPVPAPGFDDDLRTTADDGRRPVLALLANPHRCNAGLAAAPSLQALRQAALQAGRSGFVGVQLTDGSTHADVEGEDSDLLAAVACGRPLPQNIAGVRMLARRWAQDLARGEVPAPLDGDGWRAIGSTSDLSVPVDPSPR